MLRCCLTARRTIPSTSSVRVLNQNFGTFAAARCVASREVVKLSSQVASWRWASTCSGNKRVFSTPIVMQFKDVTKQLDDGRCLLKNIRLAFHDGEKIGVLGANGAGKSSLLKIISGMDKTFTGDAWADPHLKIGHLHQEPELDFTKTVFENVMDGVREAMSWVEKYEELSLEMANPEADLDSLLQQQEVLQAKIDLHDAWDLTSKARMIMDALHCPPGDSSVVNLSGGERRRVALSRLLIENPQILLLDEPTNHLDAASTMWLQKYLRDYKGTVVLVTHDRYFLDHVVDWILEVGKGCVTPFEGNYTEWLQFKEERLKHEKSSDEKNSKLLKKELEWIRSTPQARRDMNKARLKRFENMEVAVSASKVESGQIMIPEGPRLGDLVIQASDISKSFGNSCLFQGLTFKFQRGWTVGIVGGNGVGKSTFLKILLGQERPDSGQLITGSTVSIGHLSQHRTAMSDEQTVYMEISGGQDFIPVGDRLLNARSYVAQFNFKGPAQEKKIGMLSGGERNRVHLAKALRKGYNVLLLDEPTNDLDVETLRALEEALPEFNGCAVVVSHDRWFLNRICTHILAFEGNGRTVFYHGTYDEYEQDRMKRMQQELAIKKAPIAPQVVTPVPVAPVTSAKPKIFPQVFPLGR
eukprot:c7203_g1_i1.p1 GENE.c7203_g1_i1~~c7203_g1_i1.p1  ORF type:complete len:641 (+),score=106.95 c7203_g1_i1:42-1964(+)